MGAAGDDQYERLQRVRRLKRDLDILQRRQANEQSLRGRDDSRGVSLIAEARNVGLPLTVMAGPASEEIVPALRSLADWTPARPDAVSGNPLGPLQDERERLLAAARAAQNEIDAARSFAAAESRELPARWHGQRLPTRIADLTAQVEPLEAGLSDEQVDDRLTSILQLIGSDMTAWARELKLEQSESPISFELKSLTARSTSPGGSIRRCCRFAARR